MTKQLAHVLGAPVLLFDYTSIFTSFRALASPVNQLQLGTEVS